MDNRKVPLLRREALGVFETYRDAGRKNAWPFLFGACILFSFTPRTRTISQTDAWKTKTALLAQE